MSPAPATQPGHVNRLYVVSRTCRVAPRSRMGALGTHAFDARLVRLRRQRATRSSRTRGASPARRQAAALARRLPSGAVPRAAVHGYSTLARTSAGWPTLWTHRRGRATRGRRVRRRRLPLRRPSAAACRARGTLAVGAARAGRAPVPAPAQRRSRRTRRRQCQPTAPRYHRNRVVSRVNAILQAFSLPIPTSSWVFLPICLGQLPSASKDFDSRGRFTLSSNKWE